MNIRSQVSYRVSVGGTGLSSVGELQWWAEQSRRWVGSSSGWVVDAAGTGGRSTPAAAMPTAPATILTPILPATLLSPAFPTSLLLLIDHVSRQLQGTPGLPPI